VTCIFSDSKSTKINGKYDKYHYQITINKGKIKKIKNYFVVLKNKLLLLSQFEINKKLIKI